MSIDTQEQALAEARKPMGYVGNAETLLRELQDIRTHGLVFGCDETTKYLARVADRAICEYLGLEYMPSLFGDAAFADTEKREGK